MREQDGMSTATIGTPYIGTVTGYSSGILQGYLTQVEGDLRLVERELMSGRHANAGSASPTTREIAAARHVLVVLRNVRKLLTETQEARADSTLAGPP
jgi:hypothetical protein